MNPPPDPFEFLKNLWGPMGLPLSGLSGAATAMSEVDRRIAELKSVENLAQHEPQRPAHDHSGAGNAEGRSRRDAERRRSGRRSASTNARSNPGRRRSCKEMTRSARGARALTEQRHSLKEKQCPKRFASTSKAVRRS